MPRELEEDETRCWSCSEIFYSDDTYYSDFDENYRCCDCHDEHVEREEQNGVIMHYSEKPEVIFWDSDGNSSYYQSVSDSGRPLIHYGFEQECEYTGNGNLAEKAKNLFTMLNCEGSSYDNVAYLKEDGSISYGFEIVSQPGTLDFFMNHFPWGPIAELASQDFKSWNRRSCGLHIHMSRNAFLDDKHLFKFLYFVYNNPNPLIQFSGRESHYAKFSIDIFLNGYDSYGDYDNPRTIRASSFMKMAKGESRNQDRYVAANIQNTHTIELRFFRPSLRVETTKAALQFCDALFNYTEFVDTPSVMSRQALNFNSFRSWVKAQGERYEMLSNRIDERVTA
jgi:hypothetical protein